MTPVILYHASDNNAKVTEYTIRYFTFFVMFIIESNQCCSQQQEERKMITRERTAVKIADVHRKAMRRIPLWLIKKAYCDLHDGHGEQSVCIGLGVNPEIFDGVLRQALIEALWERGYSNFIHESEPVNMIAG